MSRVLDSGIEPCNSYDDEYSNWQYAENPDPSPCEGCYFRCDEGVACCAVPMLGMPWSESIDFCQECDEPENCENYEKFSLPSSCFVEDVLKDVVDLFEWQSKEYPENEYFKAALEQNEGFLATLLSARGVAE